MKRKRKQKFAFPSQDQPAADAAINDREIDLEIDGSKNLIPQNIWTRVDSDKKSNITPAEIPQIFTPEQVTWIFDAYVGLISLLFAFLLKYEFKIIFQELQFDAEDKMNFAKPLSRIISKHSPASWAQHSDEIQLIGAMGIWTAASFGRAKLAIRKAAQKKEDEMRNIHPVQKQSCQFASPQEIPV
jgi:hypothetical protein